MIRLLLADDDLNVRKGLRMRFAIEPDVEVVAEADDGAGAVQGSLGCGVDVVVMDFQMPRMDGLKATAEIRRSCPATAVVMLTMFDDPATRLRAQNAGVDGFVGKHEDTEVLLAAVRKAALER